MEQVKKEKNELWEWSKALLIAFGLAAIIRFFLFTPIVVDGESMMPTLKNGDRMVVNKIGYMVGGPDRYDIVVFHAPEQKNYIKRVIGLPGDHVEFKNDQLFINGKELPEPYLEEYKSELTEGTLTGDFTLEDITQENKIPEGYIFVMGDNRLYSKDSRHIGLVKTDEVIGSTNFVFWPMDDIGFVK
ncbi:MULTISPECIES: signal peptidase I [unclassified Psychrobacillus]|uniref:signal peptidase I n=1 Tax=unclassified Psychrobacillus TaxID=2636677 RepID=UPI0024971972|nr:signal peptidase I [Psychrobacillus sp. NEAU-3TGS]MDI2589278.1 signal peptidase I [Psychrobacillus sp. NEAU-3TGS]